jgi:Na+/proline symporter
VGCVQKNRLSCTPMTPTLVVSVIGIYFLALILISQLTSKGADTDTFFTANRQSPWYLVAFGMIGASLSGVTFVSVPGNVGKVGFGYFQVVLGYIFGYWAIIKILMPLYYRMNLVSIYGYLESRFDPWAYRTGAFFFLVSRSVGSSLRLYLAATILQLFLFDAWGVPFFVTVITTIVLIWVYTYRGGIKTIVYTDTFQTVFLISAVIIAVWQISSKLGLSFSALIDTIQNSSYSRIFYFDDVSNRMFFPKQFFGGAFIALTMTGMDQEIMQKNLTCRTLADAQKNMAWLTGIVVVVNFLFLTLGALLYLYSEKNGIAIPAVSDNLFPSLALNEFGLLVGVFFLLGITASSYASADSALAGLTTSFCIDFLAFKGKPESTKKRQKFLVHVGFSVLFLVIILIVKALNEKSVIDTVLKAAGYTYGPLLGLFTFGLMTKRKITGWPIVVVCVFAPCLSYYFSMMAPAWFNGYVVDIEILIINGAITWIGLFAISKRS